MTLKKQAFWTMAGSAFAMLTGCAAPYYHCGANPNDICSDDFTHHHSAPVTAPAPVAAPAPAQPSGWSLPNLDGYTYHSHKTIDDYSEQLAMKLMENIHFAKSTDTVAITSFVELDSNLNKTNLLGNHIADGLMGELQQFGLSVMDFKAMDMIRVSPEGDFVYSRDHRKLRDTMDIDYVLAGTMTRSNRGVLVHARLVGMESKVVVSSAKILIPNFVLYSVYSSNYKDGIHFGN